MNHVQMLELLSTLRVFRKAKPDIISSVIAASRIENFATYDEILHEGFGPNEYGYIILSGMVDVFIEGKHVTTLGKGNIFGEYAPIFRTNRTASVIAKNPLQCLVLTKRTLLMLIGLGCGLNHILFERIDDNTRNGRGIFRRA